jgi:hypothetical protein
MSFATYWYQGNIDPTLYDWYGPLVNAYNHGRILVASTGNTGWGITYPASYSFVIGVGSHDFNGHNYVDGYNNSTNTNHASIFAAGSLPVANSNAFPDIQAKEAAGTSVSAAEVSGALALYYAQGKIYNTDTARAKLIRDARTQTGYAILDVLKGVTTQ